MLATIKKNVDEKLLATIPKNVDEKILATFMKNVEKVHATFQRKEKNVARHFKKCCNI
jgi:hypothetical protein